MCVRDRSRIILTSLERSVSMMAMDGIMDALHSGLGSHLLLLSNHGLEIGHVLMTLKERWSYRWGLTIEGAWVEMGWIGRMEWCLSLVHHRVVRGKLLLKEVKLIL